MDPIEQFKSDSIRSVRDMSADPEVERLTREWITRVGEHKWAYNFFWMGRPAIQFPTDAWAMQEIIWETRPDVIVETGVAHGGSVVFYASMLAMLDLADYLAAGGKGEFRPNRRVIGVDIDIRSHNMKALEECPFRPWISLIVGSSVDPEIVNRVSDVAGQFGRKMVALDSNHTHDHVLAELEAYSPLVSRGQYLVVFDTLVEIIPGPSVSDRPWSKGDNPMTAVREFLAKNDAFVVDEHIPGKLQITVAPSGFLKRV